MGIKVEGWRVRRGKVVECWNGKQVESIGRRGEELGAGEQWRVGRGQGGDGDEYFQLHGPAPNSGQGI